VFKEKSAKELTEANFIPDTVYNCFKMLLIDVITIWCSDKMLFT